MPTDGQQPTKDYDTEVKIKIIPVMLRSVVKWIDQKAAATNKWWDLKLERIKREKEQTENVVKTNSV